MHSRFSFNPRQVRSLIHTLHWWLGLSIGGLIVIIGLSGSLLTFYPELDSWLHPELATQPPPPQQSIDQIVATLRSAAPQRHGAWRIELPRFAGAPINARYYKPAETIDRGFAPLLLTLDPGTLAITRQGFWGDDFLTWTYDLHYSLLLGELGQTLLAIGSLLILLLLLSGLYLWWPKVKDWRAALSIKSGAVWKRRVYDLHVKPGVYASLLLIVLTLTGLLLLKPDWFKPAITKFSPLTPYAALLTSYRPGQPALAADDIIAVAQRQFPAAEVRWIETPSAEKAVWRIQLRQPGEPNQRFPRSNVWIDAQSGEVLALRDPSHNSAGDSLMDWLHPLHNGEAFGLTGRLLVFLCGLLPVLAFVTGIIRWRHKVAARRCRINP